jgi:hypothetical protein
VVTPAQRIPYKPLAVVIIHTLSRAPGMQQRKPNTEIVCAQYGLTMVDGASSSLSGFTDAADSSYSCSGHHHIRPSFCLLPPLDNNC